MVKLKTIFYATLRNTFYGLNTQIPWCPIIPLTPPATVVETCSTPYPHLLLTIYYYIDQTISLTYSSYLKIKPLI